MVIAFLGWLLAFSPWSVVAGGGAVAAGGIVSRETGAIVLGLLLVALFAFGDDIWDGL